MIVYSILALLSPPSFYVCWPVFPLVTAQSFILQQVFFWFRGGCMCGKKLHR